MFDCGALDQRAFDNIVLMCKADATNVEPHQSGNEVIDVSDPPPAPGPSGINKRKHPSGFDSDDEPDLEQETDFSDLVNCIIDLLELILCY